MPIGQRHPGDVSGPAGPAPKTTLPAAGWTAEVIAARDRDPLLVGPIDYLGHHTITAAELNAGVQVTMPVQVVTYQLAVFEAVTVLVGHGVAPDDNPGGYDARHPGNGEMTRHLPRTQVLYLVAPNNDATDNADLYVYAGRYAARVAG